MPDRILRAAILTSDPVNELSWPAEIFYRRLMSVADDYGRYDARASILRGTLYPLKLNQVSEADVVKWMTECVKTGLVSRYEVEGKCYLEISKFNQRLRAMKSKYPEPAGRCQQMSADDDSRQHLLSNATESDTETDIETEARERQASSPSPSPGFSNFNAWMNSNCPTVQRMKKPVTEKEFVKLDSKFTLKQMQTLFLKIENRADLLKKYTSSYLTFIIWAKTEWPENPKPQVYL